MSWCVDKLAVLRRLQSTNLCCPLLAADSLGLGVTLTLGHPATLCQLLRCDVTPAIQTVLREQLTWLRRFDGLRAVSALFVILLGYFLEWCWP